MKALLYGPPTVQVRDRVHWRQWPGRAACGLGLSPAQQTPTPDRGITTCPDCQGRLKSWYPETCFYVRATSERQRLITPDMLGIPSLGPFNLYDAAKAVSTGLRRQMLRWIRQFGPGVSIGVVLDFRYVASHAFPSVPTGWAVVTKGIDQGERDQADRASDQGDTYQGDTYQGDRASTYQGDRPSALA